MHILKTMETTLSFDVSKAAFPGRESLADLPLLIICPAYEKIVGWPTGGEINQNGGNATAQFSVPLCEKNELLVSRLVAGISTRHKIYTTLSPAYCCRDLRLSVSLFGTSKSLSASSSRP